MQRILIVKPSSLGDIVHALPVLAALRRHFPQAHIAWLAGTSFAPLLEGHPLLDEVIRFDRRRFGGMLWNPRAAWDLLRFLGRLRRQHFDVVIDLQGLVRSGLFSYVSGAPVRVGFRQARELAWVFYTLRVRCPPACTHAVDRNLALLKALGLDVPHPEFPLPVRDAELCDARRLLSEAAGRPVERFSALVVGARWASKRWLAPRWAETIEALHARGMGPCVLLGAPDDRCFAGQILERCRAPALDLVGRTGLRQLLAILHLAQRVLCHDSGPMHLAAAIGKPVVAIFGPTDPLRTGPCGPRAHVLRWPIPCAPCRRRRCWHHSCMHLVEVATVVEHLREADGDRPATQGAQAPALRRGPASSADPAHPTDIALPAGDWNPAISPGVE